MPRVETHRRRNSKAADRTCGRCHEVIKVGQEYHTWSFRYGGSRYQHTTHGYPRPSQLTQSKLAEVYAAIEDAQDQLPGLGSDDTGAAAEDAQGLLQEVSDQVQGVAEEYAEAAEAMGDAGQENQDRADELESWASDLSSWSPDVEPPEAEDGKDPDPELVEAYLDDLRTEVQDQLDQCPL